MTQAPHRLPITDLAPLVERREVTSASLVEACLDEIARGDETLNAFITVLGDEARAQAREADR